MSGTLYLVATPIGNLRDFSPRAVETLEAVKDICEKNRIQISSRYTPLYNSYYVEGINQLYEFDCGKKSGWMYSVNGVFPNYGASSYKPKDGDKIEWVYTCNLGDDVGNHYEEK